MSSYFFNPIWLIFGFTIKKIIISFFSIFFFLTFFFLIISFFLNNFSKYFLIILYVLGYKQYKIPGYTIKHCAFPTKCFLIHCSARNELSSVYSPLSINFLTAILYDNCCNVVRTDRASSAYKLQLKSDPNKENRAQRLYKWLKGNYDEIDFEPSVCAT